MLVVLGVGVRLLPERPRREARIAHPVFFLIAAILLTPAASAAENIHGALHVTGPVVFGPGTEATADRLSAFIVPDLSERASVSLADPGATQVCVVTLHEVGGKLSQNIYVSYPNDPQAKCEWMHNLTATATAGRDDEHAGYVGIYPDEMTTTVQADSSMNATPSAEARLASRTTQTAAANDDPTLSPGYSVAVKHAQVVVESAGREQVSGSGMVKLRGLDAHLVSDEGVRDVSTGANATAAGQTTTWLILTFTHAQVTITTPLPVAFAVDDLGIAATPSIDVHALGGSLSSLDATYSPNAGHAEQLVGSFAGDISPAADATASFDVHGNLQSSTLQRVAAPTAPILSGVPAWLAPAGLVAVGLVGGGALVAVVRRRKPSPTSVPARESPAVGAWIVPTSRAPLEVLVAEEEMAAVAHDWRRALACAALREKRSPNDPAIHTAKARYLLNLGELDAALGAYEVAIHLGSEPARVDAATILALLGEKERALECLQVLETIPELVEDVVRDPVLTQELGDEPEFECLVRAALRRVRDGA